MVSSDCQEDTSRKVRQRFNMGEEDLGNYRSY